MMDLSLGTEYSLFILLITLIFFSSQEFSTNVNIWIEGCILHSNWTTPTGNDTCSPYQYRITVNENGKTKILAYIYDKKYSYLGLHASSNYSITVEPLFTCPGFPNLNSSRNIIAEAAFSSLTTVAKESENLSIVCPFHGAYKKFRVTKWEHKMGGNNTTIRTFTTTSLQLYHINFEDSGMYYCTVEYIPCGDRFGNPMKEEGVVNVTFQGPPIITSVARTSDLNSGGSLVFIISMISPSLPYQQVIVEDENENKVYVNRTKFINKYLSYKAYGKTITTPGYEMKLTLGVSDQWLKGLSIIVKNTFGSRIYKSTIASNKTENKNSFEMFYNKNKLLVYSVGCGGLLLFLLIIILAIACGIKRKKNRRHDLNLNVEQEKLKTTSVELVDSLYARPFSKNIYEEHQDNGMEKMELDREKRIENERKQIASLYSFGGFSMSEFQEEEVSYGNEYGTKYGNIV